jgi:hypothetical protein
MNEQLSEVNNYYRIVNSQDDLDNSMPVLVGDGGLEPPTSTMSTWRSTPELIALIQKKLLAGSSASFLRPLS